MCILNLKLVEKFCGFMYNIKYGITVYEGGTLGSYKRNGQQCINVKVSRNGTVPDEKVKRMIAESYDLVINKK